MRRLAFPILRSKLSLFQRRTTRHILTNNTFFQVSQEVSDAVRSGVPVVALETTLYTHGFPYPDNLSLSSRLEGVVRNNGGVPATIGVLNGVAKVGMSNSEITELLEVARKPGVVKLSRRDLAYICASSSRGEPMYGGTTIAGTMALAHLAGIRVFATGGLGGVHTGAEHSFDISADLTELGRTPVAVISSGCKSFLDIPRTLEYLETQGVCVGTFADGRITNVDFPAFWTRDSGVKSPRTIRDEEEAAMVIYANAKLGLTSGLVFANPIAEKHSLQKSLMDEVIAQAIQDAKQLGILGSENTPFILDRIRQITNGASMDANKILIENNIIRGTRVAAELAKLERSDIDAKHRLVEGAPRSRGVRTKLRIEEESIDMVVAGSLAVDLSCDYRPLRGERSNPSTATSNPAVITQSLGGVGHNVATAAHYAGAKVQLCSVVADDMAGKAALEQLAQRGMDTSKIVTLSGGHRTAQYVAFNDKEKNLVMAMADMRIVEDSAEAFDRFWKPHIEYCRPSWLLVDANWSSETIRAWANVGLEAGARIALEPVSSEKSTRLFYKTRQEDSKGLVGFRSAFTASSRKWLPNQLADLVAPNETELKAMSRCLRIADTSPSILPSLDDDELMTHIQKHAGASILHPDRDILLGSLRLLSRFPCIVTKLGAKGVLLTESLRAEDIRLQDPDEAKYVFFRQTPTETNDNKPLILPKCKSQSSLSQLDGVYVRAFPAAAQISSDEIVSVNGVGDTFLGVLVAALSKAPNCPISELIDVAQQASLLTLKSRNSVSPAVRGILGGWNRMNSNC